MSVPTKCVFEFVDPAKQPKSKVHAYVTLTYGDFTIPGFKVLDPPGKDPYVLFPSQRVGAGESGEARYKSTVFLEDKLRRQAFDLFVLSCWKREVDARAKKSATPETAKA